LYLNGTKTAIQPRKTIYNVYNVYTVYTL
jgi:hypothetical protein